MIRENVGASDKAIFGVGKKIEEDAFVRGTVTLETFGKDGKLKQKTVVPNQVTLVGDAHIADQLSDSGEAAMSHMAVGTTSGGKTEASTTLEVENTRNALTSGPAQGAGANDHKVSYVGSFTGIAATLVEAGIFNATPAGTMLCYTEFSHAVTAPDTLQITWTVTISH